MAQLAHAAQRTIIREPRIDAPDQAPSDAPHGPGSRTNFDLQSRQGPILGRELHGAVYVAVLASYAWMMGAAWLAFGKVGRPDLELAVATVIFSMFFALPFIAFRMAWRRLGALSTSWSEFMSSRVETATGSLTAPEASVQILIVPVSLAFAATLIGLTYSLVV